MCHSATRQAAATTLSKEIRYNERQSNFVSKTAALVIFLSNGPGREARLVSSVRVERVLYVSLSSELRRHGGYLS